MRRRGRRVTNLRKFFNFSGYSFCSVVWNAPCIPTKYVHNCSHSDFNTTRNIWIFLLYFSIAVDSGDFRLYSYLFFFRSNRRLLHRFHVEALPPFQFNSIHWPLTQSHATAVYEQTWRIDYKRLIVHNLIRLSLLYWMDGRILSASTNKKGINS